MSEQWIYARMTTLISFIIPTTIPTIPTTIIIIIIIIVVVVSLGFDISGKDAEEIFLCVKEQWRSIVRHDKDNNPAVSKGFIGRWKKNPNPADGDEYVDAMDRDGSVIKDSKGHDLAQKLDVNRPRDLLIILDNVIEYALTMKGFVRAITTLQSSIEHEVMRDNVMDGSGREGQSLYPNCALCGEELNLERENAKNRYAILLSSMSFPLTVL